MPPSSPVDLAAKLIEQFLGLCCIAFDTLLLLPSVASDHGR